MVERQTILVVDDIELNRAILVEVFKDKYNMLEAKDGEQALQLLVQYGNEIGAVLLDLWMPVMNGFMLLDEMKTRGMLEKIPVFLITAEDSMEALKRGYEMGVVDVIGKPFMPEMIGRRIDNIIELYKKREYLNHVVEIQEEALKEQAKKIQKLNSSIIDTLSTAIEFRDCESGEHVQRIRKLTGIFLNKINHDYQEYSIPEEEILLIQNAAVMHDVGKIAISDQILNKPGRLTKEEFEIMKTHTIRGCELLDSIPEIRNSEIYKYAYDICRHHHERWDGRGYPDGLKGNEISIWGQIVAIADVYDALVSKRVYKEAYGEDTAIQMILNGECGQFNPILLDCLLQLKDEIASMYHEDTSIKKNEDE
ncbi:MAG TPA: response regulator [Candidatus Scybalomonas excrementigallinarum]|nr:response regulator [Candidatus Scybalomonas excrementigallinarum]